MPAAGSRAREWALVIQGPLVSPLPEKSWLRDLIDSRAAHGHPPEQVEDDCAPAIEATLANASGVLDTVLLATWNDPANAARARSLVSRFGIELLLLDDPGPSSWVPGGPADNRIRQIVSSVRGLEWIAERSNAAYAMRTRSDQIVDVASAIQYVAGAARASRARAHQAGQLDFVYVPALFVASPYSIDDFYFAGALPDLLRFFGAQWALRHRYFGSPSIHVDLVLKHLYANLRVRLGARWFECYPHVTNPRDLDRAMVVGKLGRRYLDLWSAILRTSIRPLPRSVYESLVFRGVPYSLRFPRLFAAEWEALGDDVASTWKDQAPGVFSSRRFGGLGMLLNYAPEAALAHHPGLIGEAARLVDRARAYATTLRRKTAWEPTLSAEP